MNTITPPKRLIIFPSVGNNALTITSIMNAIHFMVRKKASSLYYCYMILMLRKKSKFRHLRKMIKHTNLNLSESRIPIINNLLSEKLRLYASRWRLFGGPRFTFTLRINSRIDH